MLGQRSPIEAAGWHFPLSQLQLGSPISYTPTYGGFNPATPDNWATCYYWQYGKLMFVSFTFSGTSNSTSMDITLPNGATWQSGVEVHSRCAGYDNSGVVGVTAYLNTFHNAARDKILFTTADGGTDPATFTAANDKGAIGSIWFFVD